MAARTRYVDGTVTGREYFPTDDSHGVVFRLDDRAAGDDNLISATSPYLHRQCTRCDTVGDDSLPARSTLCRYCAAQEDDTEPLAARTPPRPAHGPVPARKGRPGAAAPRRPDHQAHHQEDRDVRSTARLRLRTTLVSREPAVVT
jgi:hypothetical protein